MNVPVLRVFMERALMEKTATIVLVMHFLRDLIATKVNFDCLINNTNYNCTCNIDFMF